MAAFGNYHAAKQVIRGEDCGGPAVYRRFPSGVVGFADDQYGTFIGDGFNRQATRFIVDDARLRRRSKVSLRQVWTRFALEFEQGGFARVEWLFAFAANPAQSLISADDFGSRNEPCPRQGLGILVNLRVIVVVDFSPVRGQPFFQQERSGA